MHTLAPDNRFSNTQSRRMLRSADMFVGLVRRTSQDKLKQVTNLVNGFMTTCVAHDAAVLR